MKIFKVSNNNSQHVYVIADSALSSYMLAHKKLGGEYQNLKAEVKWSDLSENWVSDVETHDIT